MFNLGLHPYNPKPRIYNFVYRDCNVYLTKGVYSIMSQRSPNRKAHEILYVIVFTCQPTQNREKHNILNEKIQLILLYHIDSSHSVGIVIFCKINFMNVYITYHSTSLICMMINYFTMYTHFITITSFHTARHYSNSLNTIYRNIR